MSSQATCQLALKIGKMTLNMSQISSRLDSQTITPGILEIAVLLPTDDSINNYYI